MQFSYDINIIEEINTPIQFGTKCVKKTFNLKKLGEIKWNTHWLP